VGGANHRNPVAIIVPCHRIVGGNGRLTGYGGGLWRKQWLLDHENKICRPALKPGSGAGT
jgi:methylated-DNA-[protein]-cysteine S-methyltransferase